MIRYVSFLGARLAVVAFFVLTAVYAALNCSPFAFDMFIRPQLFRWLAQFVAWHHVWYCLAYALSVWTIATEVSPRIRRNGPRRAAQVLAVVYVALFGLVAPLLLAWPFLPTLWGNSRALPTALAAFLPLCWLAAIDVLAKWPPRAPARPPASQSGGQRSRLLACAATAAYLWVVHLARAVLVGRVGEPGGASILSALWALILTAVVLSFACTVLSLKNAIAMRTRRPGVWDWALTVAITAAAISEFLRRFVLPTVSISAGNAGWMAGVAGVSLACTWAGLAIRRPAAAPALPVTLPARVRLTTPSLLTLACVGSWALGRVAQLDWAFVVQRLILVCEAVLAYQVLQRAHRCVMDRPWSFRAAVVPQAAAFAALVAVPHAAMTLSAWTGDRGFEPAAAFEHGVAAEPLFDFMSDGLVSRPGFDNDYFRFLQLHASAADATITVPDVDFAAIPARVIGDQPDIFLLVIDSLRPDYLSAYNPAVTFTPNIGGFAADSFVFRNAFTRHGATQLGAPSIWTGASVIRKILGPGFERMNALEKFVNGAGYRIAINDFTVAGHLRPTTPVTTLDPGIPSVETDLCRNLESLEAHLDATAADPRPVFGYLSPMNVHILNTRRGNQQSLDGEYPGFYAPYASRVRRLDACFGGFMSYLKQRGRYDRSIILLTSDHGDSLGESGRWGHATWLSPEVVKVPMIVHLPTAQRREVTTDLARVAFTADLAPTLYSLSGQPVRDLGPLFGAPLFVPRDASMPDRHRESFLLTSSYGAAFALLRENGRHLYVTDLGARREFAYDLSRDATRTEVAITPELRRLNQRAIRDGVSRLDSFYHFTR